MAFLTLEDVLLDYQDINIFEGYDQEDRERILDAIEAEVRRTPWDLCPGCGYHRLYRRCDNPYHDLKGYDG